MKSDSGSKSSPDWRLKKTLSRKLDFRPIESNDIRFIYAAYKAGNLNPLGEKFSKADMDPSEFKVALEDEILENYQAAWTVFADTSKGFLPVGLVLGFWSHPNPEKSPHMIVGDMLWFKWASTRNKIESAVNFFNSTRKEFSMMLHSRECDKKFFEIMLRHGIMRRIGKSYSVHDDGAVTIFETREPG